MSFIEIETSPIVLIMVLHETFMDVLYLPWLNFFNSNFSYPNALAVEKYCMYVTLVRFVACTELAPDKS